MPLCFFLFFFLVAGTYCVWLVNLLSTCIQYGVINPPLPRGANSGRVASGRVGGAEGKSGAGERDRWLVVIFDGGGDSIVANIYLRSTGNL